MEQLAHIIKRIRHDVTSIDTAQPLEKKSILTFFSE